MKGFCEDFCGWHNYASSSTSSIEYKYAWIGNAATQCPSSCSYRQNINGDVGVDGMINIIAHEITETSSDPLLDAWYDVTGDENADKCAWTFGSTISGNFHF